MKIYTYKEVQKIYDNQEPPPWPDERIVMPEDYGDDAVVVGKQIKPREERK